MSFLNDIFDTGKQFLGGIAPMAGRLIGARFGGPLGSALGGGLGDMVGNYLGGSSQPQQPQFPTPRGPSMPFQGGTSYGNSQNSYGSQQPQNPFSGFGSGVGGGVQGAIDKYLPPQYQYSTPMSLGNDFGNYLSNGISRSSSPFSGFGREIGQGASALYNRYVAPRIPAQYGNVPFSDFGSTMGQGLSSGLDSRFNSYGNGSQYNQGQYNQGQPPQQYYPGTDNNYRGAGQYAGYDSPIGAGEGFVRGYSGRFGEAQPMPAPAAPSAPSAFNPMPAADRYEGSNPLVPTISGFSGAQPSDDRQIRMERLRQARSRMENNRFAAGGHVPRRTLRDMTEMFGILEHLPELEQGAY